MAVNMTVLQGRMVKDVELKQTQGGISYANFTMAWSEKYKETERKCYAPCKAWRQTAEFVDKYFHGKGSEIIVEGHLETEQWEKDGQKQSRLVLVVEQAHFAGSKKKTENQTEEGQPQEPAESHESGMVPVDDEELPF